jgi:hypothetical protein
MGTLPRSRWSRRLTSLTAAALGTALTAAIVARRRAGSGPIAAPQRTDTGAVAPRVAVAAPSSVHTPPAERDAPPIEHPVRRPGGHESDVPTQPAQPAQPAQPEQPARRPGRTRPVAVGVAVVVALAAGVVVFAAAGGDDRPEAHVGAGSTTSVEPTTTTAVGDLSPQEAFTQAADRLVSGGSFAYAGTTSAIDVSHVRPGLWLAVDLTVEGEVATAAGSVHEIAVDADGRATETVSQGPVVWGRLATSREALPEATYLPITEESGEQSAAKGVALLPAWLDSTVDRRDAGTDGRGDRVLRATLPASVLGEVVDGRPAGDADVLLTLDGAGDPVRVEVTSGPAAPPLRLALDLVRIGEPVTIDLPVAAPS